MLLMNEIRHNQEELKSKSGAITPAHIGSGRTQSCSATTQAAYSLLKLHPCVFHVQEQKWSLYEGTFPLCIFREKVEDKKPSRLMRGWVQTEAFRLPTYRSTRKV